MTHVEVQVEGYARTALQATFDAIVPIDLSTIFKGYGPLPAVVGNREQTGAWDHVGASRVVQLSDGTEAPERITEFERPRFFGYRVGPFGGPLKHVVSHADGAWWFSDAGEQGTHIRWSYKFQLHGPARSLAKPIIARLWGGYARRVLALTIQAAEA